MSDERLRLVAELQNKASAELRNLRRDMGAVKPSAGMLQTQTWFTQLTAASETASRATRPLIGGLNMIGAGGLAAGLSIAGLAKQFVDLAKALPALQELSRQTGMSRTEIERLKATASNLNVDPSKMQASLSGFSRMMVEFHKRSGTLYEEMVNHGSAGLAERIRQENPADAYKDILKWLDAIPAAAQRAGRSQADAVQIQRHWAGEAFGDEDMAQLVSKHMSGFEEAYRQAAQDVGEITDEMVAQAEKFDRALTRFDRSWTTLKQDLGTTVLPGLTFATDAMRALFDEVKHDPELMGIGAASLGALYARRKIMGAVSGGGEGGIAPATAAQIEGAAVKQGTATTTFAEAVAEFRLGVREMAARNAAPTTAPGGAPAAEPVKPGAPKASEVLKDAPKSGFLGKGGWKGAVGGIAEGIIGAMVYEYGEKAMDGLLGWTSKDQKTLDRATSLSTVIGDVKDEWFAGGGGGATRFGEDGNALRRGDEIPVRALPAPMPTAFHPADDDRASRARAADAPDRSFDGVVIGSLDKPVLHLAGTLKTAAAALGEGALRPAAFHPAALGASLAAGTPGELIAAAVKAGTLAAFREWAGMQDLDARAGGAVGGGGGFTPAAFHPGGGMGGGGGGGNPALGGGSFGGGGAPDLSGGDAQGAEADHIRELAKKYGIDPRVAVAVAKSEGLGIKWGTGMDHGTSFGAFQLHVGGGLGDTYQRETGRDPRNAANAYDMDDWALRYASKHGWGPWHGAARIGVRGMAGIGGRSIGGANLGGADGVGGAGFAGSRDPVIIAEAMLGANGSQAQAMLKHRMTPGLWCADFVNGVLKGAGGKGMNSSMASAFSQWGRAVGLQDAKRGDVILENAHGRGINHVGLVEGVDRDKAGRVTGIHMISGNYGGVVRRNLEPFGEIQGLRRGNDIAPVPAIAPEPPPQPAPQSRGDDDPSHVHVHLHQDGRVRAVRAQSGTGVRITLNTGRTFPQFG